MGLLKLLIYALSVTYTSGSEFFSRRPVKHIAVHGLSYDAFEKISEDQYCDVPTFFRGFPGTIGICKEICVKAPECAFYAYWTRKKKCETYVSCENKKSDGSNTPVWLFKRLAECEIELGHQTGRYPTLIANAFPEGVISLEPPNRNMFCLCINRAFMICAIFTEFGSEIDKAVKSKLNIRDQVNMLPFRILKMPNEEMPPKVMFDIDDPHASAKTFAEIEVLPAEKCLHVNACNEGTPGGVCPVTNLPFNSGEAVYVYFKDEEDADAGRPITCLSLPETRQMTMANKDGLVWDPLERGDGKQLLIGRDLLVYFVFDDAELANMSICQKRMSTATAKTSSKSKKKKKKKRKPKDEGEPSAAGELHDPQSSDFGSPDPVETSGSTENQPLSPSAPNPFSIPSTSWPKGSKSSVDTTANAMSFSIADTTRASEQRLLPPEKEHSGLQAQEAPDDLDLLMLRLERGDTLESDEERPKSAPPLRQGGDMGQPGSSFESSFSPPSDGTPKTYSPSQRLRRKERRRQKKGIPRDFTDEPPEEAKPIPAAEEPGPSQLPPEEAQPLSPTSAESGPSQYQESLEAHDMLLRNLDPELLAELQASGDIPPVEAWQVATKKRNRKKRAPKEASGDSRPPVPSDVRTDSSPDNLAEQMSTSPTLSAQQQSDFPPSEPPPILDIISTSTDTLDSHFRNTIDVPSISPPMPKASSSDEQPPLSEDFARATQAAPLPPPKRYSAEDIPPPDPLPPRPPRPLPQTAARLNDPHPQSKPEPKNYVAADTMKVRDNSSSSEDDDKEEHVQTSSTISRMEMSFRIVCPLLLFILFIIFVNSRSLQDTQSDVYMEFPTDDQLAPLSIF